LKNKVLLLTVKRLVAKIYCI